MKNLTFSQKRSLTVFAFSVRMFFMGMEYAVIFPSIWLYLRMFHVEYWYVGLVLSAYNAVGIASAILIGHLADGNMNLRFSALILNLAEVVGGIIYTFNFNVSMPLLGRLVSGFGEGYASAIWGEIARVTTEEERTRYFAILKGNNIFGSALGPALNLFLKQFDFHIGNWHIDFRTSPGFFMAIMWILVTGIMSVFVYDLADEMRKEKGYEPVPDELGEEKLAKQRQLQEAYGIKRSGDQHGQVTSSLPCANDVMKSEKQAKKERGNESSEASTGTFADALADIFLKFHVVAVVYSLFFVSMLHTTLQAITPLVTGRMFHWSETDVCLLFTIWGVEIVIAVIISWLLAPRVSDRLLVLVSAIFACLASIGFTFLAFSPLNSELVLYSLFLSIFFSGIAIAVNIVVCRSLISKYTNPDNQGLVQAILTACNRIASLLGPFIGTSLLGDPKVLAIILLGSQIIGMILLILAFNKLKVDRSTA